MGRSTVRGDMDPPGLQPDRAPPPGQFEHLETRPGESLFHSSGEAVQIDGDRLAANCSVLLDLERLMPGREFPVNRSERFGSKIIADAANFTVLPA